MKRLSLLLALIVIAISGLCQKKKPAGSGRPYANFEVGVIKYSDIDPMFSGGFSFGEKGKIVGVGLGALITKFPKTSGPYIPVFIEFIASEKRVKPTALFRARIGYGIYSEAVSITGISVETSGGLYFSPGIGIRIPTKKTSVTLMASYLNSTFSSKVKSIYGTTADSKSSTSSGFSFALGLFF
jgi:hypothetical protein